MNSIEAKLAVLMSNRWWEHLETFCDQALAADANSSTALAAQGFVLLRKDNLAAARRAFLDALQADPSDALLDRLNSICWNCWPSIPRAKASTSQIAGFMQSRDTKVRQTRRSKLRCNCSRRMRRSSAPSCITPGGTHLTGKFAR
jgi:hypothetical protein